MRVIEKMMNMAIKAWLGNNEPLSDKLPDEKSGRNVDKKRCELTKHRLEKGIESNYYDRGRYSPTHEKGVHHFHRILSRYF